VKAQVKPRYFFLMNTYLISTEFCEGGLRSGVCFLIYFVALRKQLHILALSRHKLHPMQSRYAHPCALAT